MSTLEGGGKIITDKLIFCVDAANIRSYVSGSTNWNDLSKTNSVGTLINGPIYNSSNGGSIIFDGINEYVSFDNTGQYTSPSITIEMLIKPSNVSLNYYENILRLDDGGLPALMLAFQDGGTTLSFGMFTSNDGYGELDVSINSQDYNGKWKHITATYTSGAKKLYVNSVLVGENLTLTGDLVPNNTAPLAIGTWLSNTSESFPGNISIVRIYSKALSQKEVIQNYKVTKSRFKL